MASRAWQRSCRLGRLRVEFKAYRHRYAGSTDRWVIQPALIYDRKGKP